MIAQRYSVSAHTVRSLTTEYCLRPMSTGRDRSFELPPPAVSYFVVFCPEIVSPRCMQTPAATLQRDLAGNSFGRRGIEKNATEPTPLRIRCKTLHFSEAVANPQFEIRNGSEIRNGLASAKLLS